MHFSPSFVLTALPFLGLASAAVAPAADKIHIDITKRSNLKKASGAVNVAALKAHVASSTAKIHNGFNAFEANTGKAHPLSSEKSRAAKRKVGSDPLTDAQEELWYGAITVGTPAVKFTVDFDTGSSDLFLPSSSCSNCGSHTKYNTAKSSTAKSKGKSFSLSYGDGSTVSGTQYTDTVTLAGLTAKSQTLGAARTYSSSFQSGPSDGLLGMGFQSISEYNSSPVFQSLVSAGATSSPVFAFKLADSGSSLTVGGVNSNLYQGDFTYVPVTQEGYWQVAFDSVNVDGQEAIGSLGAIIDSGTTLIVGDTQNVDAFYQSVQGAQQASDIGDGYYTFPCDSPPNTSITFGGQEFSIDPSTFNLGPAEDGSDQCVGGIVSEDLGESFWIVGDVFMRNVYTVFDYGNSQVGFANLA